MDPRNTIQHSYLGRGGQLQSVKKGHTVTPGKHTVRCLLQGKTEPLTRIVSR